MQRLEEAMADRLGRQRAIFMPTGTLANHLALRRHCGTGGRVAVQEQSHLFNDSGDAVQRLSSINLVPLATGRVYFTADELKAAYRTSVTGRVLNPISAVMVETPVRRQAGQVVPWDELVAITEFCGAEGIPTHLDGARLFMMAAVTGHDVRRYAGLFDSVYVSLYKYLGAPFGGILAGDGAFIDGMYHDRRMFGGALAQASMVAALALHALPGFESAFAAAYAKALSLIEELDGLPGLSIKPFEHGSNIFAMDVAELVDLAGLTDELAARGIFIYPRDGSRRVELHANTTVLKRSNDQITRDFSGALSASTTPG